MWCDRQGCCGKSRKCRHHPQQELFFAGRRPRVMGHRGAAGEAPENTLPSFHLAMAQGADVLEMDVHLTSDGHVVVCHDDTVDRTTNGSGAIAKMTLKQLQSLDAGYRFTADGGKTFPYRGQGIYVPTLDEVLASFPAVPVNIEIKADGRELVRKTHLLLESQGRIASGNVVLASFNHGLLRKIRRLVPDALTSTSVRETERMIAALWLRWPRLFSSPGRAFQVPVRRSGVNVVTPRFVKLAHKLGLEVHVWTIDDEQEMKRLLNMGVDGLFTNFPAVARRVVDEGAWS